MSKTLQNKLSNFFYIVLGLPATAMGFALCVQISALSWILSTKYNLKIDEIGLVWAAGPIAGILGQVIVGLLSDRVWLWNGRRRPFIIIGGILCSLMLLALPNLDIISMKLGLNGILGIAIVVALLLDLSINVSFNPTRSIIADVTPDGRERTKGYTWMQTISGSFGVAAYVIGATLDNYVLIYIGVVLVLILSIFPVLLIKEPRKIIEHQAELMKSQQKTSFIQIIMDIQPLWGFLVYAVYGIVKKISGIESGNYYIEFICLIITIILILKTILTSSKNLTKEQANNLIFRKVLAAHSFTWIGIQTMFIYMFAYIQFKMPLVSAIQMGQIVSISFLILNITGAILPVAILEPITHRIGQIKTHELCILSMAIGYLLLAYFGSNSMLIYLFMAFIGIGWASTISLPFAIMTQKVSGSRIGLYMGLFNLSVVLPQLVSSLGIGQLVSTVHDKTIIFIVCGLSLGISACLWLMIKEHNNQ